MGEVSAAPAIETDRQRIVAAAWDVLAANGYNNLKIQAVIRRAQVSTGGFYRNFCGKDELEGELVEQELARAANVLRDRTSSGSPEQRVRAWLEEVVGLGYGSRAGPRARWIASLPDSIQPHPRAPAIPSDYDPAAPLREAVQAGIDDGSFPDAEVERDTAIILSLCHRLYQQGPTTVARERSEGVVAIADFVVAALRGTRRG